VTRRSGRIRDGESHFAKPSPDQTMKTPEPPPGRFEPKGKIGYIILWLMGVPASVLFVIFLLRGCT